jgi:ATP-binding protein involved in chromosome partitioning
VDPPDFYTVECSRKVVMIDEQKIMEALKAVPDIVEDKNIVDAGRVRNVSVDKTAIKLILDLPTDNRDLRVSVEESCRKAISDVEGTSDLMVMIRVDTPEAAAPQKDEHGGAHHGEAAPVPTPIPGVRNIIAVASGKGGVGKSTVCVNLAVALQKRGAKVGLLDADIYGPSLHVLLNVEAQLQPGRKKEIAAVEKDGMKMMSLGFVTGRGTPVIWRGPLVQGIVKKFLQDVEWGDLDYLMVDLPPGTGDAQLTLVQTVPITSAIIVTTPSEIALVDAEKGLNMFTQVNVPVLGIVENMSYFVCPHCEKQTNIFDAGGGKKVSNSLSVDFLGEIPLDSQVRESGDHGEPIVKVAPESEISKSFLKVADHILLKCPVASR